MKTLQNYSSGLNSNHSQILQVNAIITNQSNRDNNNNNRGDREGREGREGRGDNNNLGNNNSFESNSVKDQYNNLILFYNVVDNC